MPSHIDPRLLVKAGEQLHGRLACTGMPRLGDFLLPDNENGEVTFDLSFRMDGRVSAIVGHIDAELRLECQACLQPILWHVDRAVNLGVVASLDEAALLPEPYEPLVLETGKIALGNIVEDELILALPLIARHPRCTPLATSSGERIERQKPFAILAELRKTGE